MLDTELQTCLNEAFESARLARHEFMTTEHLLLAIVNTPRVAEILRACRADVPCLHRDLSAFIDETTPRLQDGDDRDVQPTLGFQRVLQRAVFHVQKADKKAVTVDIVLTAIFSEKHSYAAHLLSMQGVTRLDVVSYIEHGIVKAAVNPGLSPHALVRDEGQATTLGHETHAGAAAEAGPAPPIERTGAGAPLLSRELELCLNEAFQAAREARRKFITVEHLLRAITSSPQVVEILRACGADVARLCTDLENFIDQTTPHPEVGEDTKVIPTLGFQRVLQRAVFHVQSSGLPQATAVHVLVAIFSEKDSHAAHQLSMQGVARLAVLNYLRETNRRDFDNRGE